MRSDMRYLVIERPRRQGLGRYIQEIPSEGQLTRNNPEALPKKGKMSRSYGDKDLSDRLQPLRRYIAKQVGRRWDDVYSEVCSSLPKDGLLQQHVYTHIFDIVETNVRMDGKRPYTERWGCNLNSYRGYARYYVHPDNGILCRAPTAERRKQLKTNPDRVEIDAVTQAHRINGLWFEVGLAEWPEGEMCVDDVLLGWRQRIQYGRYTSELTRHRAYQLYGRYDVYAVSKRSMSKKEIKRYIKR